MALGGVSTTLGMYVSGASASELITVTFPQYILTYAEKQRFYLASFLKKL